MSSRLRVLFVSQRQIERMRPPLRSAVVSITDPGKAAASLKPGWKAILRLAFDDVDPLTFPGMNLEPCPVDADRAAELARYVASQMGRCTRIVIHCRHGISRSGAVAKAVAEAVGASFPAGYREHNRHVYQMVRSALAREMNAA
jgi:predicted protein tyrosine phosphatase